MCDLATATFVPISIATTTTRESVPITHLRAGLHQYRVDGENADHVKSIAADITENPNHLDATPVIVVRALSTVALADGHHRTAAAKRAKLTHVPAIIYDVELPADISNDDFDAKTGLLAMELAAHYNRHDKMPRKWTNADKKRLGLAMLAAQPNLSDIELSKRTGGVVSNMSFANYRKLNPELQSDTRTTATGRTISAAAVGGHQPRKPEQPKTLAPAPTVEPKTLTPPAPAPIVVNIDKQLFDIQRREYDAFIAFVKTHYPTALDTVPENGDLVDYLRECVNIAIDRATCGLVPAPEPKPAKPKPAKSAKPKQTTFDLLMGRIDRHDGSPGSLNQLCGKNLGKYRKRLSPDERALIETAARAKNLTTA